MTGPETLPAVIIGIITGMLYGSIAAQFHLTSGLWWYVPLVIAVLTATWYAVSGRTKEGKW